MAHDYVTAHGDGCIKFSGVGVIGCDEMSDMGVGI